MKRRRIYLIILTCVASITLALLVWPREREPEPEDNGASLSEWLDRAYSRQYDVEFPKAIEHMGTNALPVLVRCVDYQMPSWKLWRCEIAQRLPAVFKRSRPVQWLLGDKASRRANAAIVAFQILGSRATPALNDLRRLESKHPMSFATEAIYYINVNSSDLN